MATPIERKQERFYHNHRTNLSREISSRSWWTRAQASAEAGRKIVDRETFCSGMWSAVDFVCLLLVVGTHTFYAAPFARMTIPDVPLPVRYRSVVFSRVGFNGAHTRFEFSRVQRREQSTAASAEPKTPPEMNSVGSAALNSDNNQAHVILPITPAFYCPQSINRTPLATDI